MGSVPSWTLKVVMFAVGCWLAADIANEVIAAPRLAPPPERSDVILDHNLSDSNTPAPAPVQREDIETSRLPVTLIGTFAADEPSLSRATLHDRERKQTLVVAIGDQIADQALVVRIEPRRAVLSENGALRELILVGQGASPVTRSAASSRRTPLNTEGPEQRLDSENEHAFFNQLLDQGRVLPKFENDGQMVGLEVSAIQAGSLFAEIGLENGDVITEFNGHPVDSQAVIAKVLQEMSDADEVHMAGRRADGSEQVWDFVR